jgi:hypothetical protein
LEEREMADGYSQLECLAKAVEEIREMVRPMGGFIGSLIEMTADEDKYRSPAIKIIIGFEKERLPKYFAGTHTLKNVAEKGKKRAKDCRCEWVKAEGKWHLEKK